MSHSYDSGQRPLTNVNYQAANNPYNSGAGFYGESSGFLPPQARKRGTSPWIKFGIPVLIIVIAGAVVGGIFGSRASHKNGGTSNSLSNPNDPAAASSAAANKQKIGLFATATDSYGLPVYPTDGSDAAAYVAPTFVSGVSGAWPTDTFTAPNPVPTTPTAESLRPDRPRLIAPKYKWDALASIVPNDPYMTKWNETLIGNATIFKSSPLVPYNVDGTLSESAVLDVARTLKARIKTYAYAYRATSDQQWVSRCWDELQNAAGNSSQPFGLSADIWNSQHFLDLAEFTAAFAIGYDWLYDQWNAEQKNSIMWSIINLGLSYGVRAYNNPTDAANFGWWRLPENGQGNWNCVCNSGLTMGALAILGDDPTGTAQTILGLTIPNALSNCAQAPTTDGSWTETANYWYFGTMAHAEMSSSLLTATGSDYGMLHVNKNFNSTGLYHMYITGMTSLFNYGDHGPNKYSTNADGMLFYGQQFQAPAYMLFQRDQRDSWSDPWAMFWYDPTVTGAFWENLPLDHFFDDKLDQWGSMRTSWTNNNGMYMAIKAGNNSGHQNHNDLDVGDFVLDAMGQRWAGELGSGDYNAPGYFNGAGQDDPRWLYYRKRTEGQNTVVVGKQNQLITSAPSIKSGSTGEAQDASTTYTVPKTSTAWFTMDSTSAYTSVNSMKRGLRFINGRKQALLQDEVDTSAAVQWRMHTNATVTPNGSSAMLTLGGKTMKMQILSPPGATFATTSATRYPEDPKPPAQDQDNPNVTVLTIDLQQGQNQIQVLFNPQWDGMSDGDFVTPPSVPLDSWSNTSHN